MRLNQILSEAMTVEHFTTHINFEGRKIFYTCQITIYNGKIHFSLGKFDGGSEAVSNSLTIKDKSKLIDAVKAHITKEELTLDNFGEVSQRVLTNIVNAWDILQKYKDDGKAGMIHAMDELSEKDLEDYYDDLK